MGEKVISLLTVLLLVTTIGFADEIVFKNGERLVGTLQKMENNKLVFTSEMAGEITVDLENVSHIATDAPFELHLKDGAVVKGTALEKTDDAYTLGSNETLEPLMISLVDINAINPLVKPKYELDGNITAGLTSSHGNSSTMNANIDFNVVFRFLEKHRIRVNGLYLAGREDNPEKDVDPDAKDKITTEENFTLVTKYDYFLTGKLYTYLSCLYKKDHVADLDYRLIPSIGLGYQWWDSDTLRFSTDGGVAVLKEKYTSRINNPAYKEDGDEPFYTKEVTRQNDISLQVGYNFDWIPHEKLRLLSNLRYTQVADDTNDYFLIADAEIRTFFTKSFYSSAKAILEYDNTPGEDVGSTETKYILGLGWNF